MSETSSRREVKPEYESKNCQLKPAHNIGINVAYSVERETNTDKNGLGARREGAPNLECDQK